jgi:AraC family transcriptional regulator, arabinose operon regulatory protein
MIENQHDEGRREGVFLLATQTELEKELPFHLVGVGCDFYQYPISRPFGYPVYQWIQTVSGTGILKINDQTLPVPAGSGILLHPGVSHAYFADEAPWYVHWITINGYHIESMLNYIGLKKSGVYGVSDPLVLAGHIRKALQILSRTSDMTGLDGSVMAYQFLIDLFKYVKNSNDQSHDFNIKRIKQVFDYIGENIGNHITIDDLADAAGVTPQYFCEIFKETTRQRPTEYLNQRRIDRAKELMVKYPVKKISEIATAVGFDSSSYFTTVFKKLEGLSPNKYRELL